MNLTAHTVREVNTENGTVWEARANADHAPRWGLIDSINGEQIEWIEQARGYLIEAVGWVNVYTFGYEPKGNHWKWNSPNDGYPEADAPI